MQPDRDAPLRMPSQSRPATATRIDARRHLALSSWLTGIMAVALVGVALARPEPTTPVAAAKPKAIQVVALN